MTTDEPPIRRGFFARLQHHLHEDEGCLPAPFVFLSQVAARIARPHAWRNRLSLILAFIGLTNMATVTAAATAACNDYSMTIADEGGSLPSAITLDDVADPGFKEFVRTVSSHVLTAAGGGATKPRPANSDDADVQLLFIRRPLVKQAGAVAGNLPAPDRHWAADLRRLDSPWVNLEISREPRCRIRAVFIWNERQFLRDQAALAAGSAVFDGAPVSFDSEALGRYSQDYANSVVLAPSEPDKAALDRLATRIPPEILWLYRHAVQSTRADFSVFAMAALQATLLKARLGYAHIAIALFDGCLKSEAGASEHFESVLDLKGIANLESYRVETLL